MFSRVVGGSSFRECFSIVLRSRFFFSGLWENIFGCVGVFRIVR